ncbi:unnamed protein product [Mytilus coruscus]|uniref:Uncharacterized protein n=1 Tax=Mytilus coruscus TaxID=42192 RepID=A0A6J8CQD0_MYTCO|nr:unnamed protein product [Mytilus coruscus]
MVQVVSGTKHCLLVLDGKLGDGTLQVVVLNTVYWVDGTLGYPLQAVAVVLNTVYWVDGRLEYLTGSGTKHCLLGRWYTWIPLQVVVLNTVYWVDGRLGYHLQAVVVDLDTLTGSGTKHCLLGRWYTWIPLVVLNTVVVDLDTQAVVLNTVYWVDGSTWAYPLSTGSGTKHCLNWVGGRLGYPYR